MFSNEKENKLISNFLLLLKQFFYYRSCRLFTVILPVIFSFALILSGNALSAEEEATYSDDQQPVNLYDVLERHGDAPVEFINSLYYLSDSEVAKQTPVVTITAYTSKDQGRSELKNNDTKLLTVLKTFNNGFPIDDLIHAIDSKKALTLTKSVLFDSLLKQYSSIYYKDEGDAVKTLTITIKGMLFHLEQRAQQKDPVATLILEFLKQPFHEANFSSDVTSQSSFSLLQYFVRPFVSVPEKKLTFSERFEKLSGLAAVDDEKKARIIFYLKNQGYEYQRNHVFATYELNEEEVTPVISDNLVPTYAEMQDMVHVEQKSAPSSGKSGVNPFNNKWATAALVTAVFCTTMMSGHAQVPPRCGPDGNCGMQESVPLFARDYAKTLEGNPTGNFRMAEDIYLGDTDSLPLFPNCSAPFSGSLSTGNFTLHANDSTAPLLGCMRNANVEGNINLCQSGNTSVSVVADVVSSGNMLAVQQAEACDTLRPMAANITGNDNRISLVGQPANITEIPDGTGLIATEISGNNNRITVKNAGQLYDAPMFDRAGGNENIFYQQGVNATVNADNYYPNGERLIANQFTAGRDNIVKQHGVHCTFIAPDSDQRNITENLGIDDPRVIASETTMRMLPGVMAGNGTSNSNFTGSGDDTAMFSGCPGPQRRSDFIDLLSGTLTQETNCSLSQCPVTSWDDAGSILYGNLSDLCGGEKIDTRNITDWGLAQFKFCSPEIRKDNCTCNLPNDQLHGIVAANNQSGEAWLTSRQTYPVNAAANEEGLVRLTPLFSENGDIRILKAQNESLVTELPVSQLVTKQRLLGLYPGAEKGQSVQLFSAELSGDSETYHAETFPVRGNPLLMTEDSVLVNNPGNETIDLYQLDMPNNSTGMTPVTLGDTPYKSIKLSGSENAENVFAATVKDELVYVAVTNSTDAGKVNVMRYNLTSENWDPEWNRTETVDTAMAYKLDIDNQENIRFLRRGEIVSDKLVSVSIPDEGGCLSVSQSRDGVPTTLRPTGDSNSNSNKDNKTVIIGTAAALGACAVLVGGTVTVVVAKNCYETRCKKGRTAPRNVEDQAMKPTNWRDNQINQGDN